MKNPIPRSALEHHIAFVGKTGSAKTGSTKSSIVEPALEAGERVAVIDPTGAWWGLRLGADGKSQGLPIYVFGGDHGDFPLLANQGEMLAEAIGTSNTPAILDTSLLKTSERMRFFTDFADAILRVNKGPLRLVIDEAHLFAPQAGTRGSGAMPDMLHAANNLISLGRSRGLRIVLISQRPAKVHKDSLTQVETLVAMRLIAPQDRKAVEEWIADQADKETGRGIIASLPSLKNGEGWVWSPEASFLKRVQFPMPLTYDSSKVQAAGSRKRLSPIDVEKLQAQFSKVKDEAAARDPVTLQKRIRELEGQLRKTQTAPANSIVDKDALQAAEQQGFEQARRKLTASMEREVQKRTVELLTTLGERIGPLMAFLRDEITRIKTETITLGQIDFRSGQPTVKQATVDAPTREPVPPRPAPRALSPVPAGGDGDLTGPQRQLLQALAWWDGMGHPQPSRPQLAAKARWKAKGSNLRNRLSELSSRGLVTYPREGLVQLTDAGAAAAPTPDLSESLVDSIKAILTGPQLTLFEQLLQSGTVPRTREDLAYAVGWEAGGSNLRNRLSELSSLELVTYPTKGEVALQEWVAA